MANSSNDPILRYQKIASRVIPGTAFVGGAIGAAIALFASPSNAFGIILFSTVLSGLFGSALAAMVPIKSDH